MHAARTAAYTARMPTFEYTARSKAGARVQGTLEAADRHAALVAIAKLGHSPISVKAAEVAKPRKSAGNFFKLTRPAHMNMREPKSSNKSPFLCGALPQGQVANAVIVTAWNTC